MTFLCHIRHIVSPLFLSLLLAVAATSCRTQSTVNKPASATITKPGKEDKGHTKSKVGPGASEVEKQLLGEAEAWLGTPYKYGGNTKEGVDCSGFVYHVYLKAFDIKLPRNSAKQHEYCTKIDKADLVMGDLVFFATRKGSPDVSHVGLYVGDGKMIHASTSRGVVTQALSDAYYSKAYVGAGRIEPFAAMARKQSSEQAHPEPTVPADTSVSTPSSVASSESTVTEPVQPAPAVTAAPTSVTDAAFQFSGRSKARVQHEASELQSVEDARKSVLSRLPDLN